MQERAKKVRSNNILITQLPLESGKPVSMNRNSAEDSLTGIESEWFNWTTKRLHANRRV